MIIEALHISKKYEKHCALTDANITITPGKIHGLLGPNGAGKTTLIRILTQIIAPDSGKLLYNKERFNFQFTEKIGYLPEERGLYKNMKVEEQALYLSSLKNVDNKIAQQRLNDRLEKWEMTNWRNRRIDELSKGMQQKVQFIISLLHNPDFIILDEPFSGFDPINADLIKNELLSLRNAGKTILLSTHNMASVEELCDDITLINKSNVILQGSLSDIKTKYKSNKFHASVIFDKGNCKDIEPFINIIEIVEKPLFTEIAFTIDENANKRAILSKINEVAQIIEFKELLPVMNDIFLNLVKR